MDPLGASLIEGLEDAVVVTDSALTVVAWNGVMEHLTGVARDAALGQPAAEVLDFLRDVDVASHLSRALAGEPSTTGDIRYEFAGDTRGGWIAARYVPWRDAGGAIGGVIGFHTVVTERRRRAMFVRALESIGQSLTSSLDLNETLDTIVNRALEVMAADAALVVACDGHASTLTVLLHLWPSQPRAPCAACRNAFEAVDTVGLSMLSLSSTTPALAPRARGSIVTARSRP